MGDIVKRHISTHKDFLAELMAEYRLAHMAGSCAVGPSLLAHVAV